MKKLLATDGYSIHLAPPELPSPLPPLQHFLNTEDHAWLQQCSHHRRKSDFLRGRWLAYQISGSSKGHRLTNGYLSHPHMRLSISHKSTHVVVASAHLDPQQNAWALLGIDIEQTQISQALSRRLLGSREKQLLQQLPLSLSQCGAYAFSAREALWKSWGAYTLQPPLNTWILESIEPNNLAKPHNEPPLYTCYFRSALCFSSKRPSLKHPPSKQSPLEERADALLSDVKACRTYSVECRRITLGTETFIVSLCHHSIPIRGLSLSTAYPYPPQ